MAANQGGPGVDRESIELFRNRLGRNLYALWNRMSSGSYFPQPVREVLIPKGDGQFRPLGIPTVTDRVAQMAVKLMVEARIDAIFHSSSFGYRPNKSAQQAVAQARKNCWRCALPTKLYFNELGECSESKPLKWWGWFMKAPLLFDPTAGVFYGNPPIFKAA
jgi:retron-type reverse transcriptase